MTYHAKVIGGGTFVIPEELLRDLGIKDGDRLIVSRDHGGFSVMTFEQSVRESQRRAREIFGPDYTVDQFLDERRADWREE